MSRRMIAVVVVGAVGAFGVACSGGDGAPTATATRSAFDMTQAYFSGLGQAVTLAMVEPTEPAVVTAVPETTADTIPTVEPIVRNVPALRALGSALAAVQPPPAVAAVHQALVDATRALVEQRDAAATATPVNGVTATAVAVAAETRFRDACLNLETAGQDADAPIELPCPDADSPDGEPTADAPAPDDGAAPE